MTGVRTQNVRLVSGNLTLEGVLHLPASSPSPAVAVCHPHPLQGGNMHNNVVVAICGAAAERGIAALRFNFRGVGGSEGSFGDGVGERADADAALAHLRQLPEVEQHRVGIVGYSFGAAVALLVVGEDDQIAPSSRVASLLPFVGPKAELVVVPGADHFWWGAQDRLAAIVTDFLATTLL